MSKLGLIREFYKQKDIAIIGVSEKPQKFGNTVAKELLQKGFVIYPVHQTLQKVGNTDVLKSVEDVPAHVKRLFLSVKADKALQILKSVKPDRFELVWIQQGGMNSDLESYLNQNQFKYISRECVLMHAPPVGSIHKFHRFLKYLFKEKP